MRIVTAASSAIPPSRFHASRVGAGRPTIWSLVFKGGANTPLSGACGAGNDGRK